MDVRLSEESLSAAAKQTKKQKEEVSRASAGFVSAQEVQGHSITTTTATTTPTRGVILSNESWTCSVRGAYRGGRASLAKLQFRCLIGQDERWAPIKEKLLRLCFGCYLKTSAAAANLNKTALQTFSLGGLVGGKKSPACLRELSKNWQLEEQSPIKHIHKYQTLKSTTSSFNTIGDDGKCCGRNKSEIVAPWDEDVGFCFGFK